MGASDRPEWSDRKIAALRQLWMEGVGTTEIGRQLGFSKSAIIGKARRLHLPARLSPIRKGGAAAPTRTRDRRPRPPAPRLAAISPIQADPTPTPALPRGTPSAAAVNPASSAATPSETRRASAKPCCWPIGDPGTPAFRFCDLPAEAGKPYCTEHCDIAYERRPKHRGDAEA